MEDRKEHLFKELRSFLDIYYKESDLIELDLFLSVLLCKIRNENLMSDINSTEFTSLLKDFNAFCIDELEKYHEIPSEFFFILVKDWLKNLDMEKKKEYIYSLKLMDGIDDDGFLTYKSRKNIAKNSLNITNNVLKDFETEILLQMGEDEICFFSADELLLLLSKSVVPYLEYKDVLSTDLVLSAFFNTFKDILFKEDWKEEMESLLLRMNVSEEAKRELLPRDCFEKLEIDFSRFKIKVCFLDKDCVDESLNVDNNNEKIEPLKETRSEKLVDEDIVKLILKEFQIQIIKELAGKKSKYFEYIQVICVLGRVVKPYMEGYNIENSSALSGFYLQFKDELLSEDWMSLINKSALEINFLQKLETLPHVRYLFYFETFHPYNSGEGKIYIKLKDNIDAILGKNDCGKTINGVKENVVEDKSKKTKSTVSEITVANNILQLMIEEFQRNVIKRLDNKKDSISQINLDMLLVCLGEALVPKFEAYKRYIAKDNVFVEYYTEFANFLCCDNWKPLLINYCAKLHNKRKASLLMPLNSKCLYLDIVQIIDDLVSVIVYESLLTELFEKEEIPLLFRSAESDVDENEELIGAELEIGDFEDTESDDKEEPSALGINIIEVEEKYDLNMFKERVDIDKSKYTRCDLNLDGFWNETFAEGEPLPPFWRHRMCWKSYELLKVYLKKCIDENRQRAINNHSLKLAFFISEWYRREFDGHGDKIIQELGLKISDARKIWEMAFLPECFLKKATSTKRWLDSLYVLGGLPLKYCETGYEDVVTKIRELKSEGITVWNSKDLTPNVVVNESLSNTEGSLHLFVNEILHGNYPFSNEDFVLFSNFKGLIENGDFRLEKSFKVIREYYKIDDNGIYREFRILLKNSLKKLYIPYNLLNVYGINTNIPSFRVRFKFKNEKCQYFSKYDLHFMNDYSGHFVGYGTNSELIIDDVPLFKIDEFSIEVFEGYISRWSKSFSYEPFVQIYSDGNGGWTDFQTPACVQTAVIYDGNKFEEIEGSYKLDIINEYNHENEENLCWKTIENEVQLRDKSGRVLSLYNKCVDYVIEFASLNKDIDYINSNEIKVITKDEEKILPLLLGKQSLKVFVLDDDGNKIEVDDSVLEYRLPSGYRYNEWKEDNVLNQGILYVRCGNVTKEVYYLPYSIDILERNYVDKTIRWNESIQLLDEKNFYQDEDVPSELNRSLTIDFRLGTEDCYAVIPVFRPYNGMFLYKDKKLIKSNKCFTQVNLPFVLHDHFDIMYCQVGERPFMKSFENLKNAYYLLSDENILDLNNEKISLYKWESREIYQIESEINAMEERESYQFYYWSKKKEDFPILISSLNVDGKIEIEREYLKLRRGIIFQSLKDCVPCHYYAPISLSRIESKDIDYGFMLKCFDIACEHKLYFSIFDELSDLLKKHEYLPAFVHKMYERDGYLDSENLIRFSCEFLFMWSFLKRYAWIDCANCEIRTNDGFRNSIINLFKSEAYQVNRNDVYIEKLFGQGYFRTEFIIGRNDKRWLSFDNEECLSKEILCYMRCLRQDRNRNIRTMNDLHHSEIGKGIERKSFIYNSQKDNKKFFERMKKENNPFESLYKFMKSYNIIIAN